MHLASFGGYVSVVDCLFKGEADVNAVFSAVLLHHNVLLIKGLSIFSHCTCVCS